MKVLLMCAAMLLFAGAALGDVVGNYKAHGANPGGGQAYDCDVTITKAGDVYTVQWFFNGELGYDGVGIMKNGLFCVGYAASGGYGVVVYEVKADGSLAGVWTTPGFQDTGTETLTRK